MKLLNRWYSRASLSIASIIFLKCSWINSIKEYIKGQTLDISGLINCYHNIDGLSLFKSSNK